MGTNQRRRGYLRGKVNFVIIELSISINFLLIDFFFYSTTTNCGGNGNPFLYVPRQNINPCEQYSWKVTIVIGLFDKNEYIYIYIYIYL